MSDESRSLRGLQEPEIVGESQDVKDEAKELRKEDIQELEKKKNSRDEMKKVR